MVPCNIVCTGRIRTRKEFELFLFETNFIQTIHETLELRSNYFLRKPLILLFEKEFYSGYLIRVNLIIFKERIRIVSIIFDNEKRGD